MKNFYSFDSLSTSSHECASSIRGVDYLQYQFTETQIHNCWKVINSANRLHLNHNLIPQSTDINRLENIAWRRWGKIRAGLEEVNPKSLNWYKECDITWIYGPLIQERDQFDCEKKRELQGLNIPGPTLKNRQLSDASFDSMDDLSSSVESSPFDSEDYEESETDYEEDVDDLIEFEDCKVKSILKGIKDVFEVKKAKKIIKSVSFAEMVQIRQF